MLLVLAACRSDGGRSDAAIDGYLPDGIVVDAATDAPADALPDAATDAAIDAPAIDAPIPIDAAIDAPIPIDAAIDAPIPIDAAIDAPIPIDAAIDAPIPIDAPPIDAPPPDGGTGCVTAPAAPIAQFSLAPEISALVPKVTSAPLATVSPLREMWPTWSSLIATAPTEIDQRILLISATATEPAYRAAGSALSRIGVPFTTLIATQEALVADTLWTATGGCRFSAVILANSEISALDASEWQLLDDFELACDVREVEWFARATSAIGLTAQPSFTSNATVPALLTAGGAPRFPYLHASAPVVLSGVYGYPGHVIDPAVTTPLLQTAAGDALAVVHTRPDGREVLAMLFDSSPLSRHAMLLEFGVIEWASRGLFLGARRLYLSPQIDDVFIEADMWGPGNTTYRTDAASVQFFADWQATATARLPAGSTFVTQLAFNGAGTDADLYPDTAPITAWRARQDEFVWINHTWNHENLDGLSAAVVQQEVAAGCTLGAAWGLEGFTCASLVTPDVSGLDTSGSLAGMTAAGVRVVVSDTSITAALNPDNPGTNPSFNVGRVNPWHPELYQVPRHPTNVFYNCSTAAQNVDEFNFLYHDEFGRDLTYAETVALEADVALRYLLSYDVDPLMFHQANLRMFTGADMTSHTLYGDYIDALLDRYVPQVNLPVWTLDLEDTARVMQERGAYDTCQIRAVKVAGATGSRLELTGAAACVAPVTGLNAPSAGRVEMYGGVPTTFVPLPACQTVSIPLP